MLKFSPAIALVLISASAAASTPAAWARLERQATRKCIEASELRRPRVSNPIVFSDQSGVIALLVTGIHPQARMKGASGTNLCLFDRRTGHVAVEEAKDWSASRR